MKKIISSLLAAAMLVSAFAAYAAAPQTPSDGSFDIAYIGSESSKAWQEALTSKLDESIDTVTGIYTTAATMQEAQLNIPQVKAAKPDMVVIDASIAQSTENQYFESILLSLLNLDELPYVAYVTDAGFTATDTIRQITSNFGGEWLSLADAENASSAEDYAAYLASGLEYKKLTVPSPAAKLSSYSSDMSPVSQFSGTLTDETKVINTYGNYIIVKTRASEGNYTISLNGMPYTVSSVGNGISFSRYDLGQRNQEIVIKATGTVEIEGVYSEAQSLSKNLRLGFEDNDLTSIERYGGLGTDSCIDINWSNEGANGSTGSVHAKVLKSNGEIVIPYMFESGVTYNISANIKVVKAVTDSIKIHAYQKLYQDGSNLISYGHGWSTGSSANLGNDWIKVTRTFTTMSDFRGSAVSNYGEIAFRLGSDNEIGNEFYIDDIVIEPATSVGNAIYSLDMDFEDESVSPGVAQTDSQLSFVKGAGEDGGTVLQATAYADQIISISNVYLVPNRHYTISYKIKGISENSQGKNLRLIIDRAKKHFNSKGEEITSESKLANYEYKGSGNITNEWQTVTEDYVAGNKITDEMGLCSLYFKLFNDASSTSASNTVPNTDKITIQIDDFKITPNEIIYNGDFEMAYLPTAAKDVNLSIVKDTGMDGNETNVLQAECKSSTVWEDIFYYSSIICGKTYKLNFKVKGKDVAEGTTLQPILSGANKAIDSNNDFQYREKITLSNTWKEYSTQFSYFTNSGINKFPLLILRLANDGNMSTGTFYLDDIKIEEIPTEGLYNIQLSGDMMYKERSKITFSDYSASNKGYIYTIYSLDSSKNKTIYAYGETTGTVINFNNFAIPGTQLYADIVYVNEAGTYSSEYTADLGVVGGDVGECVITAAFSADSDMTGCITGQVAVSNNGQARKVMIGVATYGETKNLLSFDADEYEVTPYMNRTFELPVYPDADLAYYAKVFAWDPLTGITPYCPSDMIEY